MMLSPGLRGMLASRTVPYFAKNCLRSSSEHYVRTIRDLEIQSDIPIEGGMGPRHWTSIILYINSFMSTCLETEISDNKSSLLLAIFERFFVSFGWLLGGCCFFFFFF